MNGRLVETAAGPHVQLELDLEGPGEVANFDGVTYDPLRDYARLGQQMRDVWDALRLDPYRWWTLSGLQEGIRGATGRHHTEAALSARLRDLRKVRYGRYVVERRPVGGGLFVYRLDPEHYLARLAARRSLRP